MPNTGVLTLSLLLALGNQAKAPVPDVPAQQKAEKEIRSIFKKEFDLKDREGRKALAQKLLVQAGESADTVSRFALLTLARDLSLEGFDFATSFGAVEKLFQSYELVPTPLTGATFSTPLYGLKASVLAKAKPASAEEVAMLLHFYLVLAREAMSASLYDDSATWADLAAKNIKEAPLAARAAEFARMVRDTKKETEDADKALAALSAKPEDPDLNLVVGRFLIFSKNEPEEGLKNLLKAADPALRDLAKKEIAKPADAEGQYELGDGWWSVAKKEKSTLQKKRYSARARTWLELAMGSGMGLGRIKAEKRLEEVDEAEASGPVADLIQLIDPKKDSASGVWEKAAMAVDSPKPGAQAWLKIPYQAPVEFDLRMVLEKQNIHVLSIHLGVGDSVVTLDNQSTSSTISVGGKDVNSCGPVFDKNKAAHLLVSVRLSGISVYVDQKLVLQWQGNYSLGPPSPVKPMMLGSWGAWHITKMMVIPISGQGRKLR